VAKSEAAQARIFPDNLLINKSEAKLLSSWCDRSVHVFPPYISSVSRPYKRTWDGTPVFVFLGGLDVPHNAVSLENFIDGYLPNIIRNIPGVLIRVIGKNPAPSLVELVKKFPLHVRIEGYVDSLDEVLHGACAMLVPLLFGSGVKLKTIDALSYGLPIIATDFGVEGVGVSTNYDCIVENDLSKYGYWMEKLIDPDFNKNISCNSYEMYLNNYSKDSVMAQYSEIFGI
jgi:glycosyltransferase involved in cell wall biosynthesis